MITFEVRHWITNHEADIGTKELGTPEAKRSPGQAKLGPLADAHNTVGNIFYGSKDIYPPAMKMQLPTRHGWARIRNRKRLFRAEQRETIFKTLSIAVVSRKKAELNAPIEEGHISCALVHLANASYRLGRTLNFNPETQQVIGDDEGDGLLRDSKRRYRQPFSVPQEV